MQLDVAKDAIITLRIDPEDKKGLEVAARRRGLTLTSFITQTMLREAEQNPPRKRSAKGKVPLLFRTACDEAKRGGARGYVLPGRILLLHAVRTLDEDALDELAQIMFDAETAEMETGFDERGILKWCEAHVPECAKTVPIRRRRQFAEGLLEAYSQLENEQDKDLREKARALDWISTSEED